MTTLPLSALGRTFLAACRALGGLALVLSRTIRAAPSLDRKELARSLAGFGADSLPLVAVVSAFMGGILVLMANVNVQRYGARSILGWAAGYSVLREFGPLVVGLVLAGRVGARNASELATMGQGGQLEGLLGVGVDPFALLVAPRVAASAIAVAAAGLAGSLVAVLAAAVLGQLLVAVDAGTFLRSFELMLGWADLAAGAVKLTSFGLVIALVSTHAGLSARGGARAVGRAAAGAVFASAAAICGCDWLLTLALEGLG